MPDIPKVMIKGDIQENKIWEIAKWSSPTGSSLFSTMCCHTTVRERETWQHKSTIGIGKVEAFIYSKTCKI